MEGCQNVNSCLRVAGPKSTMDLPLPFVRNFLHFLNYFQLCLKGFFGFVLFFNSSKRNQLQEGYPMIYPTLVISFKLVAYSWASQH